MAGWQETGDEMVTILVDVISLSDMVPVEVVVFANLVPLGYIPGQIGADCGPLQKATSPVPNSTIPYPSHSNCTGHATILQTKVK